MDHSDSRLAPLLAIARTKGEFPTAVLQAPELVTLYPRTFSCAPVVEPQIALPHAVADEGRRSVCATYWAAASVRSRAVERSAAASIKPSPGNAVDEPNPHSRPTAHQLPAGSFFGGFRTPAPSGSTAHTRPASETLHDSGPGGLKRGGQQSTQSGRSCRP